MEEQLIAQVRGGIATVTLNRPRAHNALSFGMLVSLARRLDQWERDDEVRSIVFQGAGGKAFCAGGDIRALHQYVTEDRGEQDEFFRVEYSLDYRIHTYPKPITAIIDGIVMGGGMGISQGAELRLVGRHTRMAMPETAIGIFPDVGGSYFLSRTPGRIGFYLGLTGVTIHAEDAIYAGLADDFVPGYRERHNPVPISELERLRPAIDRHFGAGSVKAILESLAAEDSPEYRDWAQRTVANLRKRSPTLLAVTHEQIRRGATLGLADCFRMELNMIHACFEQGDMLEGIRALIIDKDNRPRWNPAALEDVGAESVARFFTPRWEPARHPLANLETQGTP